MTQKTIKSKIANNSCLLNKLLNSLNEESLQPCYNITGAENVQAFLADTELVNTVEGFLENNLNISKTSQKTFMHRNTLLYRIEKINKLLGLDIRKFEDAITLKIMLILNQRQKASKAKALI